MECQYCKKVLSTKSALNAHQTRTKYCLKIQGKQATEGKYNCFLCGKVFFNNNTYKYHQTTSCKTNSKYGKLKTEIENIKEDLNDSIKENIKLKTENDLLRAELENFRSDYKELSITACLAQNFAEDLSTIEIENDDNIDTDKLDEENNYQLTPLEVGSGYTIEHRDEDGYINVTNLCKAGGKQFKHWNSLDKTKAFLHVLSSEVGIPTSDLIKLGKSTFSNQGKQEVSSTWVHPQIAINIAQWISPRFDVKVSGWVYEVMMTGKVDITNTKSYKELQKENKDHKIKIKYLTKKYVKRQPRIEYTEKNVIYILTTPNMKKERRYILGKAENLTNRLSVYNKSDEHEVIYYQGCGDIEDMNLVEPMVFKKLNEYREQANRERFVLNEGMEISYFINVIKECIKFFEK